MLYNTAVLTMIQSDRIKDSLCNKSSVWLDWDWVEDSTQSVWNVCIKFYTWKEHWKLSVLEVKKCCSKLKTVLIENHVNRKSKRLEITT